VRSALIRHARGGGPAAAQPAPVTIVLTNAFGMGGTIGTSLSLAAYLAQRRPVEIVSVFRHREQPFFDLPPGVRLTVVQDRRSDAPMPRLARALRRRSSLLMHRADRTYSRWSLLTDVRFARMLRRRRGVVITTRPGLNLLLADTAPAAIARMGQEHMHLLSHRPALRRAIADRYPKLDSVVVLTDTDRRNYERLLGPGTPIEVVPNSVRRLGGPSADLDARLVFSAGRFSPQKGYDLLIPAYAEIAAAHPDWRLRICGTGPLKAALEELVERHALREAVTLAPPARDVGAEMARASIYVLSSRFEGFPLVLIEAMSKGMAVVAYDCPTGPADVIEDGRNGLLVPPEDVTALAGAIERLIGDGDLRRRLGAAAAETASAFTMDTIGPRWDALLTQLAEDRARDSAPRRR
jgi:glycosyltransferase involved in cell wall biosynthesis